jgi:hypothetical protein
MIGGPNMATVDEARAGLRLAVGAVQEAMHAVSDAGLNPQTEIMQMVTEAFAAEGQDVPPMLRMLLG